MKTKTCPYTGETFVPDHGNSKYLPNSNASYQAKLERQNKKYPIGNDAKKAIQKNYKIFQNLLGDNQNIKVDLLTVLKLGFDQSGYYGSGRTRDTKKQCYKVHDCYFHITTDNPQKIEIWKMPTA